MKNNTIQKNIPDGWWQVKIRDVAYINKKTLGNNTSDEYAFKYVDLSAVNKGLVSIPTGFVNYKNAPSRARRIIEIGDVLMATVRPNLFGHCFVDFDTKNIICSTGFAVIQGKRDLLETRFVYHYLFSDKLNNDLNNLLVGSNYPAVNSAEVGNLDFSLPSIAEQRRIVTILDTSDLIIEKLSKKIQIKKNIKKGLMQNLLTGDARLVGFTDKWQTIKLNDLGKTYAGIIGKDKDDFGSGKPFITYMNIYSSSIINPARCGFVKINDGENQNKAKFGDIFFTTSSETPDEVGTSSVLLDKNVSDLYLNSFCFGFRLNNFKTLTPEFSQFYFRGQKFRKQMVRIAQGASRYNLSKKYFLDTSIKIPSDTKEQNAIADILRITGKEIKALEKKLSIIKNQKKYLLNNLITGTIRTKA